LKFNQRDADLTTLTGDKLRQVDDFKYLGSWVVTSRKGVEVRIGLAWKALNKLEMIWKSKLSRKLKIQFFGSMVKSVLLYGAECWTITSDMKTRLDGNYTRMLRPVLGFS